MKDLLLNYFGTTNFLLILLVSALFWIRHLQNRLTERDDREKSFEQALVASKMRVDALQERLRISADQSQLADERSKIIDQRNLLADQRLIAGEELLRVTSEIRSVVQFRIQAGADMLSRDILLVEDEKALHFFKESIEVEFPGLRVRLASNGAEALAALKIRAPNLVITDLVMPVLDGFQLIERVRDNYPDIAVLAVSAYVDTAAQIASKIGALPGHFEFLPKPITLGSLVNAIRRLMNPENERDIAAAI